ncbi:MAG: hypothetical protein SGILL_004645 [Bacillariaceae sp.]
MSHLVSTSASVSCSSSSDDYELGVSFEEIARGVDELGATIDLETTTYKRFVSKLARRLGVEKDALAQHKSFIQESFDVLLAKQAAQKKSLSKNDVEQAAKELISTVDLDFTSYNKFTKLVAKKLNVEREDIGHWKHVIKKVYADAAEESEDEVVVLPNSYSNQSVPKSSKSNNSRSNTAPTKVLDPFPQPMSVISAPSAFEDVDLEQGSNGKRSTTVKSSTTETKFTPDGSSVKIVTKVFADGHKEIEQTTTPYGNSTSSPVMMIQSIPASTAQALPVTTTMATSSTRHGEEGKEGLCLSTASMVCGIVGLFVFGVILGTVAVVMGSVAMSKIGKEPERYRKSEKCKAIAGLVCGIVGLVLWAVFLSLMFV